ncbi:MAG: hypothetical protein D6712_20615 [Chloroflexi bacterium]|nr:MAG: hypothetical protein D6712_20615 [Chloroflexota bacterium]
MVVEGYNGGRLVVAGDGTVTAIFYDGLMGGKPCRVTLGPVLADLAMLKPGEYLARNIPLINAIYAEEAPPQLHLEEPETVVYICSHYTGPTNQLVVGQRALRVALESLGAATA